MYSQDDTASPWLCTSCFKNLIFQQAWSNTTVFAPGYICNRVFLSYKDSYCTHNSLLCLILQYSSTIGGKQVFDLLSIVNTVFATSFNYQSPIRLYN